MNIILEFDINTVIIFMFLVLFGVLVEKWMAKRGFVRDKTYLIIIVGVCSVLIKHIWFPAVPWLFFIPLTILAMILGANRGDLWTTINRGRWWWKQN